MRGHANSLNLYPSEGGYVVRLKKHGGRRLVIKLAVTTEDKARHEAIGLLTEALMMLRAAGEAPSPT